MKTATEVKQLRDWRGDARLYKLSEPAWCEYYDEDAEDYKERETDFVIVSAVNFEYAHETYIFPAYDNGAPIAMSEMTGSYKGGTDHEAALNALGYEIA